MPDRKFKVGDIIVLRDPISKHAKVGAKARVTGFTMRMHSIYERSGYGEWVDVVWLDDLGRGQCDGGYVQEDFDVAAGRNPLHSAVQEYISRELKE